MEQSHRAEARNQNLHVLPNKLVARTVLALVIPCEQVGNAYVVELVQRQQQSGFGIDPQFEVNSSVMVAACGSSVSSSMQLCISSGA